MNYFSTYDSPLGELVLAANDGALTGLWMAGQRFFASGLPSNSIKGTNDVLKEAECWLDSYFAGERIELGDIPIQMQGTPFQKEVFELIAQIPYGCFVTYGDLASDIAHKRGITKMSAQAIGGAVGHNPISIIVPCHRVLAAGGKLGGYGGGLENKRFLLRLEGIDFIE